MKLLASYERNKKKNIHFLLSGASSLPSLCMLIAFLAGHEADAMVCQMASKYYASKTEKSHSLVCGLHNCISISILQPLLSPWLSYSSSQHEFHLFSLAGWLVQASACTLNKYPSLFSAPSPFLSSFPKCMLFPSLVCSLTTASQHSVLAPSLFAFLLLVYFLMFSGQAGPTSLLLSFLCITTYSDLIHNSNSITTVIFLRMIYRVYSQEPKIYSSNYLYHT